jgi:hypothetical protein
LIFWKIFPCFRVDFADFLKFDLRAPSKTLYKD